MGFSFAWALMAQLTFEDGFLHLISPDGWLIFVIWFSSHLYFVANNTLGLYLGDTEDKGDRWIVVQGLIFVLSMILVAAELVRRSLFFQLVFT